MNILVLLISVHSYTEENGHLVLTDLDFQTAIQQHRHLLLFMHSPWNSASKRFFPIFQQISDTLSKLNLPVKTAYADIITNKKVAHHHREETDKPHFYFFTNGDPKKYGGRLSKQPALTWALKHGGPSILVAQSLQQAKMLISNWKISVVLFASKTSEYYEFLNKIASKIKDPLYIIVQDPQIATHYNVTIPALVLLKSFDERRNNFQGQWNTKNIEDFVTFNKIPRAMPLDQEAQRYIFDQVHKSLFLFRHKSEHKKYLPILEKLGKSLKSQICFTYTDLTDPENKRTADFFGLKTSQQPSAVILDQGKKYFLKEKPSQDSLQKFISDQRKGLIEPTYKSQEIPLSSYDGKVRVLVAKNFKQIVEDSSKDVLVQFYAPWCGHCKKLAPEYRKLASQMGKHEHVIIAKIDGTQNQIPQYPIKGFPTILFFPGNDKRPRDYRGEHTKDGLAEFIKAHASFPLVDKTDL